MNGAATPGCPMHKEKYGKNTQQLANKLFYWPGMPNNVCTFIQACKPCYKRLPSQKKNPSVTSPPSESFGPPMAQVGLDLFDFGGKKHLIFVSTDGLVFLYSNIYNLSLPRP